MIHNQPESLIDIIDEARSLLDDRIDEVRSEASYTAEKHHTSFVHEELSFLKDLRSLLALAENFRY